MIVILKKRKTNVSHLPYATAQRQQRQDQKKVAKSLLT